MNERIKDKIEEINGYVHELSEFMPADIIEYKKDSKTKAACERYFEKIVEAATDLAFLTIKDRGLQPPQDDREAFEILLKNGFISRELAMKLKDAKGMRNVLAHQYGVVDDERVFHAVTEDLFKDIQEYISAIKKI